MNAVYTLIWNVSTGTWAVAHELAASRGRKAGRSRLATALAAALALPAGAAFAADSSAALQCAVNEAVSADGLRCEAAPRIASHAIGTRVAGTDSYEAGGASAEGARSVAIGQGAAVRRTQTAVPTDAIAIGYNALAGDGQVNNPAGAIAIGSSARAIGTGSIVIGFGAGNDGSNATVLGNGARASRGTALGAGANATVANSVALGTNSIANRGDAVSIGSNDAMTGFTRQLTNLSAGTADTDAVNLGQMTMALSNKVNNDYLKVGPGQHPAAAADNAGRAGNIAIGSNARSTGNTANSATIALGENAVSTGAGSVALATDSTATGSGAVAIGLRAATSGNNAVALGNDSVADDDNTLSIGNAALKRRIVNMAAGVRDTDAVNVSQLKPVVAGLGGGAAIDPTTGVVTGPTYNFGGNGSFNDIGAALGNLDGRVDSLENSGGAGGPGLVERDAATGNITVASKEAGGDVNLRDANGDTRILTGIKAGTTRTDAVNFGQLVDNAASVAKALGGNSAVDAKGNISAPSYSIAGSDYGNVGAAFDAVDTSLSDLGGRVGNVEGDITHLTNGTVGVVKYDAATREVNVATDMGGDKVNFAGTDGERTLAGVKAGMADTDAANVGQLKGTAQSIAVGLGGGSAVNPDGTISAPNYSVGGTTVGSVGDAITNLDGRTTTNTSDISNLTTEVKNLQAGVGGIVAYDDATGTVQVASTRAGDRVDFTGTAGDRTLAGVKAGTADNDAANVGQLKGTAQSIADGLGGGSVVNPDGTITAPSYSVGGTTVGSVGDAIINMDGRITTNAGDISHLTTEVKNLQAGVGGIVAYDDATGTVQVASTKAGDRVDFTGTAGGRALAGVADGRVADDSDEAVNGSQLNATNERVAANETSINNLSGRVDTNEGDINNLTTQVTKLSKGAAGLVTIDATTGTVRVAAGEGGDLVDMEGTEGKRRVGGVANGIADGDAVTMAQLRAAGAIDPVSGEVLSVLTYDDSSLAKATLGGTHGTVIGNLGNGLIAADSREAVNGGQLYQMNAGWEARWGALDGRVGTIEQGIADGSIGGGGGAGGSGGPAIMPGRGDGSVAVGDGADAGGAGSVAIGEGASATGGKSVAVGAGSDASGENAVAIGAGSRASRDNEFSVGSEGNERIVGNVAAGVRPTDAVNVQQMNDRFDAERRYVDDRFHSVDKRFDRMGAMSSAYAGMAINTAGLPGDNRVGAGVGAQNGRTALAVGYQRILGERKNVSVSLGGAFSGSDRSVSAGAGYSW